MSYSTSQLLITRRMGLHEPNHQMSRCREFIKADNNNQLLGASSIMEAEGNIHERLESSSQDIVNYSKGGGQGPNRANAKILRRLAQNREAARKSRLRKKVYVQQLESCRLKLCTLEKELHDARQQGVFVGGNSGVTGSGLSSVAANADIATFQMEYEHWVEEQTKHTCKLREAIQQHASEVELQIIVESGIRHYNNLFCMKAAAAKTDVFYVMSGMWKTVAERCFQWIGGFRPSELLKVLIHQLDSLTEQQLVSVRNLQQCCLEAEEALCQGMDRLQQTLSETVALTLAPDGVEIYMRHMASAVGKLEVLGSFINEADHLRLETLQQMYRILTVHQIARALLALGDYIQRLRALSTLWVARPHEPS